MFANIRSRLSRKSAFAIAVFAVALTASGVGSLATLNDTATTVISASITSIDLTANGTKSASIDFGQVEPGTIGYAPIVLHNAGSGYLRLTASSTDNGSAISAASLFNFNWGIPAANCNAADTGGFNLGLALPLTQPVLDLDGSGPGVEWLVGAGGTTGIHGDTITACLVYRVGLNGGSGYGQTGFSTNVVFSATHP